MTTTRQAVAYYREQHELAEGLLDEAVEVMRDAPGDRAMRFADLVVVLSRDPDRDRAVTLAALAVMRLAEMSLPCPVCWPTEVTP